MFVCIGKSLLAKSIQQQATARQLTFAASKLDQLQNTPLACFKQIIDELLMRILMKDDIKIQQWKSKFMAALSTNAALMANIFPLLEHIIGKQPKEAFVPPTEARAR